MKMIFRPENLTVSYTADREGYKGLETEVRGLKEMLHTEKVELAEEKPDYQVKNEGFKTSRPGAVRGSSRQFPGGRL